MLGTTLYSLYFLVNGWRMEEKPVSVGFTELVKNKNEIIESWGVVEFDDKRTLVCSRTGPVSGSLNSQRYEATLYNDKGTAIAFFRYQPEKSEHAGEIEELAKYLQAVKELWNFGIYIHYENGLPVYKTIESLKRRIGGMEILDVIRYIIEEQIGRCTTPGNSANCTAIDISEIPDYEYRQSQIGVSVKYVE